MRSPDRFETLIAVGAIVSGLASAGGGLISQLRGEIRGGSSQSLGANVMSLTDDPPHPNDQIPDVSEPELEPLVREAKSKIDLTPQGCPAGGIVVEATEEKRCCLYIVDDGRGTIVNHACCGSASGTTCEEVPVKVE